MGGVVKWLWRHRNYVITLGVPVALLPLPLVSPTSEARCGYAILLMALYWCTECLPLAVTALLPVVLFPMMGIMEAGQVSIEYLKDTNMLFISGLLVAIAVEQWNLHKRIALRVLLMVGVRPALLMMGFMLVSAFLSMWISNTATTAMMLPIAHAVLRQLKATRADLGDGEGPGLEMEKSPSRHGARGKDAHDTDGDGEERRHSGGPPAEDDLERVSKGISLCVCYSASIGGTATLTGTMPNLILKGQLDKIFPQNKDVINFTSWFGFAFPNMVVTLLLSWLWLQFLFLGFNFRRTFGCGSAGDRDRRAYAVMKEEYEKLGGVKFAEGAVLCVFILLVLLWFTREPGFIEGWAGLLFNDKGPFVTDGTVAILMSALFFVIPSRPLSGAGYGRDDAGATVKAPATLLTWQAVHQHMPWNIVLLLGGGYALAAGSEASGLSLWLGRSLSPLAKIPAFAISLLLCLLVATFTECSSNTATTTLFLPVLASMAVSIKLHPLYVMLPCTVAASLAFMLPVATPPNAIAFSFGNLRVMDMVKAGLMLNVIGILSINLAVNTWGRVMFDMDTFPAWANASRA